MSLLTFQLGVNTTPLEDNPKHNFSVSHYQ